MWEIRVEPFCLVVQGDVLKLMRPSLLPLVFIGAGLNPVIGFWLPGSQPLRLRKGALWAASPAPRGETGGDAPKKRPRTNQQPSKQPLNDFRGSRFANAASNPFGQRVGQRNATIQPQRADDFEKRGRKTWLGPSYRASDARAGKPPRPPHPGRPSNPTLPRRGGQGTEDAPPRRRPAGAPTGKLKGMVLSLKGASPYEAKVTLRLVAQLVLPAEGTARNSPPAAVASTSVLPPPQPPQPPLVAELDGYDFTTLINAAALVKDWRLALRFLRAMGRDSPRPGGGRVSSGPPPPNTFHYTAAIGSSPPSKRPTPPAELGRAGSCHRPAAGPSLVLTPNCLSSVFFFFFSIRRLPRSQSAGSSYGASGRDAATGR